MSMLFAMLTSITARGLINPIVVAAPAGQDSALYFVLRKSAQTEDRLLEVTCACARRVEIHNMVTRDGARHMDVEPALVMPPERLVEIRPGGSRHLMLIGLRRPLVAGERVAMTFRYARGSETRDVRVVANSGEGWAGGLAQMGPRRLAPMDGLAGACWRGTFPGGRRTDTRCFSPAYGNFMQDVHTVEGGPALWVAHTMYRYEVMAGSTSFRTSGPDGMERFGRLAPTADSLVFLDYPGEPGREISTRTSWTRDGADAWLVRGERLHGAEWRELWRLRMVRAGASPPQ